MDSTQLFHINELKFLLAWLKISVGDLLKAKAGFCVEAIVMVKCILQATIFEVGCFGRIPLTLMISHRTVRSGNFDTLTCLASGYIPLGDSFRLECLPPPKASPILLPPCFCSCSCSFWFRTSHPSTLSFTSFRRSFLASISLRDFGYLFGWLLTACAYLLEKFYRLRFMRFASTIISILFASSIIENHSLIASSPKIAIKTIVIRIILGI